MKTEFHKELEKQLGKEIPVVTSTDKQYRMPINFDRLKVSQSIWTNTFMDKPKL